MVELAENGESRLKQPRYFYLEHAHQIGEHAYRCKKAHPCQAEHDGAAILLVVGNTRMTNHNHGRLPRFGMGILDPFSYPKNEDSFPHCTNPSLLKRRKISSGADFAPQPGCYSRRLMV